MSIFDSKTCGRCGGSGNYSYNSISGTVCFGCNGTKKVLTPKGKKARAFFEESMMRPVEEVQVGEMIYENGWRKVRDIKPKDGSWTSNGVTGHFITLVTQKCDYGKIPGTKIKSVKTLAERDEKLATAVKYQDTLKK